MMATARCSNSRGLADGIGRSPGTSSRVHRRIGTDADGQCSPSAASRRASNRRGQDGSPGRIGSRNNGQSSNLRRPDNVGQSCRRVLHRPLAQLDAARNWRASRDTPRTARNRAHSLDRMMDRMWDVQRDCNQAGCRIRSTDPHTTHNKAGHKNCHRADRKGRHIPDQDHQSLDSRRTRAPARAREACVSSFPPK
jgi:hypothetical protein